MFGRISVLLAWISIVIVAPVALSRTGVASADPVADKFGSFTTDDGWVVNVFKTDEKLDRWPNLAATAYTREGFYSVKGAVSIEGEGRAPVNAAAVQIGLQLGCQIDVSTGLTAGLGLNVGVNGVVTVSQYPSGLVGGNAGVNPSVSGTLKPGGITQLVLGAKSMTGAYGSIATREAEMKVDACGGPVSVRSVVTVSLATPTSTDSFSVYGDPVYV
ncbi:MspA family porin [Nocardia colli]|uniref:MspA family porin n=1 Tax=Nocardia colli TaxID=2545717 RepID=UPI0035DFA513